MWSFKSGLYPNKWVIFFLFITSQHTHACILFSMFYMYAYIRGVYFLGQMEFWIFSKHKQRISGSQRTFFFCCTGSVLLLMGFLYLWHWGAWASHYGASLVMYHLLRCVGSEVVAHGLSHFAVVEFSQTRDRTHVPCIGRQILNHWTTRKSPKKLLRWLLSSFK